MAWVCAVRAVLPRLVAVGEPSGGNDGPGRAAGQFDADEPPADDPHLSQSSAHGFQQLRSHPVLERRLSDG